MAEEKDKKDFEPVKNIFENLLGGMTVVSDEEAKRRDEEIAQIDAENLRRAREEMFRKSGIAEKFADADLKDILSSGIAEMKDHEGKPVTDFKFLESFIADIAGGKPRTMLVFGGYGTGKSVFAAAVMHELCRKGVDSGYFKSHEILQRLDDVKWHTSKETRNIIMRDVCSPSFRVIDEIGRYPDARLEQFVLFDITNRCYETYRSSIYITNLTRKELGGFLGGAVIDRFKGFGMTLEFSGKSFRGTEKELYTK